MTILGVGEYTLFAYLNMWSFPNITVLLLILGCYKALSTGLSSCSNSGVSNIEY